MKTTHTQCLLSRDGWRQVAWIPSDKAEPGRVLRIKTDAGWEEGWSVVEAYDPPLDSKIVQEREGAYRTHRKGSDV